MKPSLRLVTLVALPLLASCGSSKSNTQSAPARVSVGQAMAGDMTVELFTDDQLETGLTPIYIKVAGADGSAVTDAQVTFFPLMSMSSGKQHSCPVIGAPTIDTDGLYRTAAVFQMASTDMDKWSATVSVNDSDADANVASFSTLNVSDSGRAQVFSYTDPNSSETVKMVSSLNFEAPPAVGLNPIVFTLHKMLDMMTFAPVDDVTVVLDPQMPSMGHGSPGSVNPTPTSLGRFQGQLSFSMAGTWETTVTVNQAGVTLGTPKFTTTF
jgi:hypothetical protein